MVITVMDSSSHWSVKSFKPSSLWTLDSIAAIKVSGSLQNIAILPVTNSSILTMTSRPMLRNQYSWICIEAQISEDWSELMYGPGLELWISMTLWPYSMVKRIWTCGNQSLLHSIPGINLVTIIWWTVGIRFIGVRSWNIEGLALWVIRILLKISSAIGVSEHSRRFSPTYIGQDQKNQYQGRHEETQYSHPLHFHEDSNIYHVQAKYQILYITSTDQISYQFSPEGY